MEQSVDYLIIGGGIAGITAAETIRAKDTHGTIAVISAEESLLYSRVLLPSYLKQRIKREQVFMRRIEDFDAKNIHVHSGDEVIGVNPQRHDVTLRTGEIMRYGKLLIAAGARPKPLPFVGNASRGIYRLHTIDDADALYHDLPSIQSAVVAGGGFIALEFVEMLHQRGIATTLIYRSRSFFEEYLSVRGSELLEENMREKGVSLSAQQEIASVTASGERVSGITTASGAVVPCDALCVGIGVVRNTEFLAGSGIEVSNEGIVTNEYLETSVTDVYAAGDVASYRDIVLQNVHTMGTWNNAFLQGQAVGRIMAGERAPFRSIASYSITNLGMHLAVIGQVDRIFHSVIREDATKRSYQEYFFRDGVIVGATLLNSAKDQAPVHKWILERKKFSAQTSELGNIERELSSF